MHKQALGLEEMGTDIEKRVKAIAGARGLEYEMKRDIYLPPGDFWPEAVDWYVSSHKTSFLLPPLYISHAWSLP